MLRLSMLVILILGTLFGIQGFGAERMAAVSTERLSYPPPSSAWKGSARHVFLEGQAALTCGSHGTFSGQQKLPTIPGTPIDISYAAVFTGQLTLKPPLVAKKQKILINDPIRIAERVTLKGGQSGPTSTLSDQTLNYVSELTTVVFNGTDFPNHVVIRESPRRPSPGKIRAVRTADGRYSIRSRYDVWLEISVDGGKNWQLSEKAVRMKLVPDVRTLNATEVRKIVD